MTATQKFYTGFLIALALVIAVSYYLGYRAGAAHGRSIAPAVVHRPTARPSLTPVLPTPSATR